jgi:uncharacterized protein (DUF1501 family)
MAPRNCCDDFTRSRFLQRTAAAAGDGLPAIEPGMPLPAGTGLSRRAFLSRSVGGMLAVYGAGRLGLPAFEEGIANAAGGNDRVLVSVFLSGGLDGMSVLVPTESRYAQLRSTLAVDAATTAAYTETPGLRWSTPADPLRVLHGEGKVTVMPAIGYAHPDQSHFTSRHFWEVGATDVSGRFGWLGRFLDGHGAPDNPLQGLSLDWSLSPGLAASSVPVASVPRPDDFGLWTPGVGDPISGPMHTAIGQLGGLPTGDPALLGARLVASGVDSIRRSLEPYQDAAVPHAAAYPAGSFARRLEVLAAMLAGGLPIRAVSIEAPGGYDTHANQAGTLAGDVSETVGALYAFQRDLEARGLADRVLVHAWSEFGRRPQENGTGTDHGAAGLSFLIGTKANGTQIGEWPGLTTLDAHGNLLHTTDYRAVYCSLLEQWYGVDAAPIIPGAGGFARPQLVKA